MFDLKNTLNKLVDAVPEDLKEQLEKSAMEKLGLSKADVGKSTEAAAAPAEQVVDQVQAEGTPDTDVQGNDSDQAEQTAEANSEVA